MMTKIKKFLSDLWKNIEDAQMARARAALKNGAWSRIE